MSNTTRTFIPCHSPMLFRKAEKIAHTNDGVICVILCAATIEAFVNDLTEWYMYSVNHNTQCESFKFHKSSAKEKEDQKFDLFKKNFAHCFSFSHSLLEIEERVALTMTAMEADHASIFKKIAELYELLANKKWQKGTKIHQDFNLMINIRNSAVHMKGSTLVSEIHNGEEASSLKYDGHPDFIERLSRRNIIEDKPSISTWMNLIEGVKFCEWILNVTFKTVQEIIELLPDSTLSNRFKENVRFI